MSNVQASNAEQSVEKLFSRASAEDFRKISGSPIAYWVGSAVRKAFETGEPFGRIATPRQGLATGRNEVFLREWHEINFTNIGFGLSSREQAQSSGLRWFPYNKGGEWRKWYGNNEFVVDWQDDGVRIRGFKDENGKVRSRPQNTDYYFREGITWADITKNSFAARYSPRGFIFDVKGSSGFPEACKLKSVLGLMNCKLMYDFMLILNPTSTFQVGDMARVPYINLEEGVQKIDQNVEKLVDFGKADWDSFETSWDFTVFPLLHTAFTQPTLKTSYQKLRAYWSEMTLGMQRLEEENNRVFIDAYGLQDELTPKVPLDEITLTCNPHYRYGGNRSEEELETLLQCDTLRELVSYAIGCMMGRYSLDKPGLILASQGETLQDYLQQIPNPSFAPDNDAILPLTDQEWFTDDATNRFREFIRTVWGDEHLQQNLDFVAESLCLHAIKAKRGESALDTIRRYLSTQFFKDHLRTYKKRPIYWLFSSGKQKAFECLVYLHRYNESTLARMRTEYVIPLTEKLAGYVEKLEQDKEASASAAEAKRIEKELSKLYQQQTELNAFDEKLRHHADQRISLDLDDGVKVNYGKFSDLLAEVKSITGKAPEVTL